MKNSLKFTGLKKLILGLIPEMKRFKKNLKEKELRPEYHAKQISSHCAELIWHAKKLKAAINVNVDYTDDTGQESIWNIAVRQVLIYNDQPNNTVDRADPPKRKIGETPDYLV